MRPVSVAARRWAAALGYIGFIYATLSLARRPLLFLRSHGALRATLSVLFVSCFVALFVRLAQKRSRDAWRYGALAALGVIYYLLASGVPILEERIHFLQYGLVGVLFARALISHTPSRVRMFAGSFVLACLAGFLDESLQFLVPGRHFDTRDILLNILSAGLGLIVYAVFPHPPLAPPSPDPARA